MNDIKCTALVKGDSCVMRGMEDIKESRAERAVLW